MYSCKSKMTAISGIALLVSVWWIANAVTSIASKQQVSYGQNVDTTLVFTELKWLELTMIQFVAGGIISAIAVKFTKRDQLPFLVRKGELLVIISNLFGHLAVNLSYCFISSGTTQVIKSAEPIFIFFLLTVLGDKHERNNLTPTLFSSLVLLFLGTCLFLIWDVTFNIWGMLAAIVSNIAFPIRNISIKMQNRSYKSSFEIYFRLSFYGSLIMAPVLLVKILLLQNMVSKISKTGIIAGTSHCIYNIASISVLKQISPMTHGILNFSKRIVVIVANLKYFHISVTWQMGLGLSMVVAGLALYSIKDGQLVDKLRWPFQPQCPFPGKAALLVGLGIFIGFFIGGHFNTSILRQTQKWYPPMQNYQEKIITTSWLYQRPIPNQVIENIKLLGHSNSEATVNVYCGSRQCVSAITSLNNPKITANSIIIPDLLRGTPLKAWFMRHPLNKILAGVHFEDHLQEAVKLAHLWHHGGVFVAPTVQVKHNLFSDRLIEWITLSNTSSPQRGPAILDVCSFPPEHHFIRHLMDILTERYADYENLNMTFSFGDLSRKAYMKHCQTGKGCPVNLGIPVEVMENAENMVRSNDLHFGTLGYEKFVARTTGGNLGDEVQSLSGVQFLPFVDFIYDREYPDNPKTQGNHIIFYNAWWAKNLRWPPPPTFDPIMLSMHITTFLRAALKKEQTAVDFLNRTSPIGCRDTSTLGYLRQLGIPAFFSGCLTLMMQNPNRDEPGTGKIYFVDVDKKYLALMPRNLLKHVEVVTHRTRVKGYLNLFREAYELLAKYSRATVVVSQRIHAALPCAGMGIPIIFINGKLPGGSPSRITGLTTFFHFINAPSMTSEQLKEWFTNFNWTNPPSNPNLGKRMSRIASFWNVIRRRPEFYDTAHTFGLIPLTPRSLIGPSKILFHVVFLAKFRAARDNTFRWNHWRCIESILYHHPDAELVIHSNFLEQSTFDVLTEVGYDVKVKKHNLFDTARGTPFETIVKEVNVDPEDINLMRLLILYKYGGLSVHLTGIILKPMYDLGANVLMRHSEDNSGVVMKFEKKSRFLKSALDRYFTKSKEVGQGLSVSKIWASWSGEDKDYSVEIIPTKLFDESNFETECLINTSGDNFKSQRKKITEGELYAVELPWEKFRNERTPSKHGTICEYLLNSYCLFCDNIY